MKQHNYMRLLISMVIIMMLMYHVVAVDRKSKTVRMITTCWETTNPTNITALCSCDYECSDNGRCAGTCPCQKDTVAAGTTCESNPTVLDPPVECYGVSSTNTTEVCSGHGECIDHNMCDCQWSWDGEECDDFKPYTYVEPYLTGSMVWLVVIIILIIFAVSVLVGLRCILYLTAKNHIDGILAQREKKQKNLNVYLRLIAAKVSMLDDMQQHISRSSGDINRVLMVHLKRCSLDDIMALGKKVIDVPNHNNNTLVFSTRTPKEELSLAKKEEKRKSEQKLRASLDQEAEISGFDAIDAFLKDAKMRDGQDEFKMVREALMELLATNMKGEAELLQKDVFRVNVQKNMNNIYLNFLNILRVHHSDFPVDVIDIEIQQVNIELTYLGKDAIPPVKIYRRKGFPQSENHKRIHKEVRAAFNRSREAFIESLQQEVESIASQIVERVSENKDWEVVYLCEKLHNTVVGAMLDLDTPLIVLKILGPVVQTIIDRDENNYKVSLGCIRVLVDIGCLCVLRQRLSGIGMNSSDKEQLLASLDDFETKFFLHPEKFDPTGQLQFYIKMLKQSLYMMDDTDDFWELVLDRIDLTAPGEVIELVKRTIQRVPNRWYIKCLLMWIHGHTLFQFDTAYSYGKELLSKRFLRYRVSKLEILPFIHHHQNFILIELIESHLIDTVNDDDFVQSTTYNKLFSKLFSFVKVRHITKKNIDLITHSLMAMRKIFSQSETIRVKFFESHKVVQRLRKLKSMKNSKPIREHIQNIIEPPSEFGAIDEMMRNVIPCLEFLSLDINLSGPQVSTFYFPHIEQTYPMDYLYELFSQESIQIVIKASGGQGKSCILRHIAFYLYDQLDIYPLFIRADVLATHAKQWTDGDIESNINVLIDALFESHDDAFSTILSESSRIQLRIELRRVMKLKPLALIIDGFDEIPGLTRNMFMKLFNKISNLTSESGSKGELHFRHLLFSSRPEALSGFELPKIINYAELQLLTPSDGNELVRSVLLSVLNIKSLADSNYGTDIFRRYSKTPLNVTNPLLAILLIRRLLDSEEQDDYQITNRYLLYEHLMRAAIDQAKTTRNHPEHSVAHASRYWIMTTYSIIAYILHRLPNATRFDIIQIINQNDIYPNIISREVWLTNIKNPAQNIIETLVAFSTLANQQQNQIVFSHRSIQEFFVARFLSNTSEQCNTLRIIFNSENRTRFSFLDEKVITHDWWREVFKFVIANYLPSVTLTTKKENENEDIENDEDTVTADVATIKNNPFTSVAALINSESRVSTLSIVKQLFKYYFCEPREHTPHYDLIYKILPQAIVQDFDENRLKIGLDKLFMFIIEGAHFNVDLFYSHLTNIGIPLKISKPSIFKTMNYYHVPLKYNNYSGTYAHWIDFPYFVVGDDHKLELFHMSKANSIFKGSYGTPNDTVFDSFRIFNNTVFASVDSKIVKVNIKTLESLDIDAIAPFELIVDKVSETHFGDNGSVVYENDDEQLYYISNMLEATEPILLKKFKGYINFCHSTNHSICVVVQNDIPNPNKNDAKSDSSVDTTITSDTCYYYELDSGTLKEDIIYECQDPHSVTAFYKFDDKRFVLFLNESMVVLDAKTTTIKQDVMDLDLDLDDIPDLNLPKTEIDLGLDFGDDDKKAKKPSVPSPPRGTNMKTIHKVINQFTITAGNSYKLFPEKNMVAITYSTHTFFFTLEGQLYRMYDIPIDPFTFNDFLHIDSKQIEYIHAVDRFNEELFPLPNTKPSGKKKILSSYINLEEYNVLPEQHFLMLSTKLLKKSFTTNRYTSLHYINDDRQLLIAENRDGIVVYNMITGEEKLIMEDVSYKQSVLYKNRFLYIASVDGKLFSYDLEMEKSLPIHTFPDPYDEDDPKDICLAIANDNLIISFYEKVHFLIYSIHSSGVISRKTQKSVNSSMSDCDKLHSVTIGSQQLVLAESIEHLKFYDLSGRLKQHIKIEGDMDRIKILKHEKTEFVMCIMHESLKLFSMDGLLKQKFSFAFTNEEICTVTDIVALKTNVPSSDDFGKFERWNIKDYSLINEPKFFFLVHVEDYLALYDSRCPDPLFYFKPEENITSFTNIVSKDGEPQILICQNESPIIIDEKMIVDVFCGSVNNLSIPIDKVDHSIERNIAKSQTELLLELVTLQRQLLVAYSGNNKA